MSYAVIFASKLGTNGVAHTAVVPNNGRVRVFSRIAGSRGTAGAWAEAEPFSSAQELVIGTPASVRVTDNDEEALYQYEHTSGIPKVLLQKLVRKVDGVTEVSDETVGETLSRLKQEALNPESLVKYIAGGAPAVRVVRDLPSESAPVAPSSPVILPTVPVSADVSALIPTPEEVAGYFERTLPGSVSEIDAYDYARKASKAVAIYGHAGTGKTSSAKHYAGVRGLPFVRFECNPQVDEEVVQGTFVPTGNGNELVWRYSELAQALTQPSVILLNESNRMSAKANALFLGILQERELRVSRHHGEVLKVHPECLIITDANPGYRGTVASDQAFLDRFAVKLHFKYDTELEAHFIPSPSLLELATSLREQADREDKFSTPVSTRLLKNFVDDAQGLGLAFAIESFVESFAEEERDALRLVIEVYSSLIAQELGVTA